MSTCRSVLFWIFTWWCKYFRLVRTYVPIRQLYLAYVIRTGTNCCPVCVENTINRSQSVTFFISSMVVQEQYSHAVSCASDRIHCHLNIYKLKLNWNYTFTYFFRKKKRQILWPCLLNYLCANICLRLLIMNNMVTPHRGTLFI